MSVYVIPQRDIDKIQAGLDKVDGYIIDNIKQNEKCGIARREISYKIGGNEEIIYMYAKIPKNDNEPLLFFGINELTYTMEDNKVGGMKKNMLMAYQDHEQQYNGIKDKV